MLKLLSWNVNGIRAIAGKGFADFVKSSEADVICLQETKAEPDQVDLAWAETLGYRAWWNPAQKRGYSGTVTLSRLEPLAVRTGLGRGFPDTEGRVLTAEFPGFRLVNVYTPNARHELVRLPFRLDWDAAFRRFVRRLARDKPVVFCGDLNVAHQEIDLANPRSNRRNPGFSDEERESFSRLLAGGFVDTFRARHPDEPGQYSWWSYRGGARSRNVGWRIDYFGASRDLAPSVSNAFILPEITGSDHCPVGVEIAD